MTTTGPGLPARQQDGVRVVGPGQGEIAGAEDAAMMIKISSDETDGRWALLAGSSAPGFESGLHRHAEGAKGFYVIEGTYEFYADGRWLDAGAGDTVFVPAGSVHGFRAGPNGGRGLVIYPGRQERWFAQVAEAGGPAAIGAAAAATISASHGVTQCGPLPAR
jgi:mannose-6-phosphate isomerase-like protein (cupin superfamily)